MSILSGRFAKRLNRPIGFRTATRVVSKVKHYNVLLGSDWLKSASIVAMFGVGNWYTLAGGDLQKLELLPGDAPSGPEEVLHVDVCHITQIGAEEERIQASVNPELQDVVDDYAELLVDDITEAPGTDLVHHSIELANDKPLKQRPYRTSPENQLFIEQTVDDLLKKGLIIESDAPWCSPLVIVSKKDGSKRMCPDYRKLNELSVPDVMPMPLVQDMLLQFSGCKVFSTMHLCSGFWQVQMHPKDIPKTTFTTKYGNYAYKAWKNCSKLACG